MPSGIKDIAKEAGVSQSAVSQALNGYGRMSVEKRKKICEIAERLRYRPNLLVEAIQSGKTKTLGIMMGQGSDFHSKITKGICDESGKHDYAPFFITQGIEEVSYEQQIEFQIQQLHRLVDRHVDGLIIMSSDAKIGSCELVNEINFRRIPKVVLDMELPGIESDFSGVDNEEGGRLAAVHLAEKGHKKALIVCQKTPVSTSEKRKGSFLKTAKENGLECVINERRSLSKDGVYDDIVKILSASKDITAVFCIADYMALDVYQAAATLKLRIPEDLSVCGFGNTIVGEYMTPALTTINQFAEEEGREAVRIIIERLSGILHGDPVKRLMKPELIIRNSVAIRKSK